MDQLLAIRVFVGAVESGSLAAAGRQLGLSPAMAGRHLRALEDHLNVRLLQRSTRQLSVTEAGQRYVERCKPILAELDDASREVADRNQPLRGTLRVSAPVTFGHRHLGSTVSRYLAAHPGMRVELSLTDRHVDLLAAGIDVAIRIGELFDENLTVRRLASCHMVACAAPGYLQEHGVPATPSELSRHACLAFKGALSTGDWTFIGPDGERHAGITDARLQADNMDMLRATAITGGGIVYGPDFALADALSDGSLVRVLENYRTTVLPVHAVFPTARYIPRMVRDFVDRLAAELNGESTFLACPTSDL
ncbi:LysR family transcriptional regulator [Luteibacter jiangsuensis]|uniref:LysR family transcriptional regulator n=1 Tax=Luteibacter jiangsuensis TaxID=637577 RepID=A0ABX0Q3Z5_9GAMM|nr:LysR family transcriptional regulator [Luteibacter jiangsuensis]NID04685.1 LysR family transcriptional regulator [Luteibacter jiangsuensis]